MKHLFSIFLFLVSVSTVSADWDYKYLTLKELVSQSSLIVVAEIKTVEEKADVGKVSQKIGFTSLDVIKGKSDLTAFTYYAAFIPGLCEPPESFYIDSPPKTKYLLFLSEKDGSYTSVLGSCGALRVTDYDVSKVFWYTDTTKAQRFSEEWKEKSLEEVIVQIKEKLK